MLIKPKNRVFILEFNKHNKVYNLHIIDKT